MTEMSRRKRSFYIYISYIFSLSALLSVSPTQPINILSHGLFLLRNDRKTLFCVAYRLFARGICAATCPVSTEMFQKSIEIFSLCICLLHVKLLLRRHSKGQEQNFQTDVYPETELSCLVVTTHYVNNYQLTKTPKNLT
jgi:hypothetical protein